ncbi:MAG: 3-demethylubiquinone-9 3-O-methyltransferase [Acidobacteria bacterium]|jgi:2-polyprenyl-6-hydroxyphenyl methylase/3-demethylubiquinone-9 3-methyltransferase|nr:3-demethylubiquinone-9 3-O-methyltransferase [Acidobacteriota bacterium]
MTRNSVDNSLYRNRAASWWDDDDGAFSTIRHFINPARCNWFRRVLEVRPPSGAGAPTLIDVGCGGGYLAEEFARMGCRVTGVDAAPESLTAARRHSAASRLDIDYVGGRAERLPFPAASFDLAACCDVLEHVDSPDIVIAEIARVLRPGGLFFFDTINRTLRSRIAVIGAMQNWRATAFVPPDTHAYRNFIKPRELKWMLETNRLIPGEMRGLSPHCHPLSALLDLHRRARGAISFEELGRRLAFGPSGDLSISYIGYAKKKAP